MHDGCTVEISCRELRKGEYRDTVIISGGGIETPYRIPVQVVSVPSFIETWASDVTATEALIHWINYPEAIDYQVSLRVGEYLCRRFDYFGLCRGSWGIIKRLKSITEQESRSTFLHTVCEWRLMAVVLCVIDTAARTFYIK